MNPTNWECTYCGRTFWIRYGTPECPACLSDSNVRPRKVRENEGDVFGYRYTDRRDEE